MRDTLGRLLASLTGIAVALGATILLTGPAVVTGGSLYHATRTVYSPELGGCFRITLAGEIRYRRTAVRAGTANLRAVADRTLADPALKVQGYGGSRCRTPRRLSRVELRQDWYDASCRPAPGVSVTGTGFAVAVAPTVACDALVAVAGRSSGAGGNLSAYRQVNPGRVVRFADRVRWRDRCLAVDATATVHLPDGSDTVRASFEICP
ncbi:hypothetical protein AB0J86_11825 [Micromonospora sp. NPDC049559]|uniref:hypothetical protein n=1 Tax=Micromonospora sp. NPDC049559 TaxID=3155923 RepID=UPI00341C4226